MALRVCASCEYVFLRLWRKACPKCGFGDYDAVWVYESRLRAVWSWLFQGPYRWRRACKRLERKANRDD